MKKICFATNNQNKLEEIKQALKDEYDIHGLKEIGCFEELPETQDTLEGNSLQKASHVWKNYQVSCFADDTGLEIDALNGEPGVYSARYAGEHGNAEKNMALVLKKMEGMSNRNAAFKTIITLILDGKEFQFLGEVKGKIRSEKSGDLGFGYDPIFEPVGYDITFAEMDMEEKNRISHRGLAVKKLLNFLKEL